MRFEIELSNYREIERLFFDDKEKFAKILRTVLEQTNKALKDKRFDQAEKIYNMDYLDMLQQLSNAFFNKEGIINRHQNDAEKEGLRGLAENIHPLAIFTNDIPVYNANGEDVSPYKWIEQGDFNLENWLYSLFYGARFVSWDELAEYLMLGEYELMDVLKAHNFPSLATIQPALQFQKENNIPVGKLIPGTGLFDGGDEATKNHDKCPACENVWNTGHSKYGYCNKCRLGGVEMSKDTLIVKSLLIRDLEAMLKREKEKLAHIKKQKYSESRILHEYFHDGIIAGIEKTIEAIKGAL